MLAATTCIATPQCRVHDHVNPMTTALLKIGIDAAEEE
jgi:hypothetical protein